MTSGALQRSNEISKNSQLRDMMTVIILIITIIFFIITIIIFLPSVGVPEGMEKLINN